MIKKLIAFMVATVMVLLLASCVKNEKDNESGALEDSLSDTSAEADSSSVPSADVTLERRISFLAAGDNIIHECVYLDAATVAATTAGASDYYFNSMYSEVEEAISSADIAFINAEGPLDTDYAPNGYPNFNAPKEAGEALVDVGFDIVNLANNHMLDLYKGKGLQGTIDYWKDKSVTTVGAYESFEDYDNIRIVEKDGIKIAVLSYTYGTNGISLGSDTPNLYIPYIDDSEITRQIDQAKQISDFVIVSMHWGDENSFVPNSEQKRLAKLIADCEADVILGHHSHTLQPVEWVTGESGNKTLVAYSLGNFLHTQLNSKNLVGGVLMFDILQKDGERPTLENPVLIPTVCHYTANTAVLDSLDYYKRENLKIYWLSDYTEALAASHGSQYWGKFTLETLRSYVTDTVSAEFLPSSFVSENGKTN